MEHGTGIKELELVNIEWQVNHHLAKQPYRQQGDIHNLSFDDKTFDVVFILINEEYLNEY